jgi:surface antigen
MKPIGLVIGAVVLVPALFLGLIVSVALVLVSEKPAAASCAAVVPAVVDGVAMVDGFSAEQVRNASAIIRAAQRLNLPVRGQVISVMVALGESGLSVLDYGDGPGPDSRGLFQQRDNGSWGSYEDRMNPTISATNFIRALQKVGGWELLEPTIAANRVQRNADPYHYRKYWAPAVKIVDALSDVKFSADDCAMPGGSGAGDDLPWKNGPTWAQVGANALSTSPLGMYNRECVDFALWRVNQQMGSTGEPFKFLNGTFRPDGQSLGSALTWKAGWDAKGWPTGSVPRVGAVVWYAPGAGGADPTYGHVAVVKEVRADGTYVEEGYNGNPPPDDHNYYTRTVSNTLPSAFLYLPTQEEKK